MNINTPHSGRGLVLPGMRSKANLGASQKASNRLPFLKYLPSGFRNHFVAMCGEFAGTFLFLFFAFSGTQIANTNIVGAGAMSTPNTSQLLYIALSFGFSLAVNAWVFFRISGGLFNPAVSFGMCLIGALPWLRGMFIIISQILAGIASAAVVSALFPGPLTVRTQLGAATSPVRGLFIEMFLTSELVFTIFMLAAEKHKGTFIAPIGIGLSLFVAELGGVYYTGGSLNPARSFGPNVVLHQFNHYHWIYWVGPLLGALLACGFYKFIKILEYETANPGQDLDEKEAAVFDPDKDVTRPNVSFAPNDYIVDPNGEVRAGGEARTNDYEVQERQTSTRPQQSEPHPYASDQAQGSREYPGLTYPATAGASNYDMNTRHPKRTSHDRNRDTAQERRSRDSYHRGPEIESGVPASRRNSVRR